MLLLLLTCVTHAWAYNFKNPKIYFNNADLKWENAMLLVGHGTYSCGYDQTTNPITDTKLVYFAPTADWGDQDGFTICNTSGWDCRSDAFTTRAGYTTHIGLQYSYGFNSDTYYVTGTTGVSPTISVNYISGGYGSIQKYNATQAAKKRDTGTTYTTISGSYPATLQLKGTYLSGDGASSRSTIESTTSTDGVGNTTYGAVVTGLITHSLKDKTLTSSYYLEGWGTGSTPSVTTATYDYNISAATTVYAFFSKLYTLDFDVKGTAGSSTVSASVASYTSISSGDKVPTGHTITVTASPATGYEIVGWYSDASCTSAYTNGSGGVTISGAGNKNFSITSLNSNSGIYCKLRKKTYSITLNDDGDYQGDGSATVQYGDAALTVVSHARRTDWNLVGYWNSAGNQVTDSEGALLTSVSGYTDGSGHWIYDGNVTLYAHWSQTYSLTVAAGSNISSVSGSNADVTLNSKYAISATPNTGYSFSGWTASPSANAEFDDASAASTNVTVKNGSVTVTGAATENLRTVSIVASPAGAGTFTVNSVSGTSASVGVTTSKTIVATPINDFNFTSWSATNCTASPTNNRTTTLNGDGSTGSGTLTATFTPITCKVYKMSTAVDGSSTDLGTMSYNISEAAYYLDVTTNAKPYYFRFHYTNGDEYSATWNGDYPNITEVVVNGSKVDCAQKVVDGVTPANSWDHKPAMYFDGLSGSPIRIWFDFQNKKTWITETTYSVSVSSEDNNRGTVNAASVMAGKNTAASINATPVSNSGWMFKQWSVTSPASLVSSATTASNSVKATGGSGAVQAQFKHRYILRGSIDADGDPTGGMAGWSATDNSAYTSSITSGVYTITANLTKAKTRYKFRIKDLTDGTAGNGQTGTGDIPNNKAWTLNGSNDVKLTTTAAGTYTFTYTVSTNSLKVVFPTSYTITYEVVGGTGGTMTATVSGETVGTSPGKAAAGSTVRFSASPSSGYEFTKWVDGSGSQLSTSNPYDVSSLAADKTVKAVFTAITYNSGVLKKNGGDGDGSYSVTYMGTSITPSAPTKTGYHVDGYYAEAGTSTHIATAAGVLQNNKSGYTDATGHWNYAGVKDLYAKWQANTYTAENNIDGNGGSNGKYTATYDATNIAINTAPTRTGYNLTGYHAWGREANTLANTAGVLSASQSENKDGGKTLTNSGSQWIYDGTDATIYADWSPKTYSISLDQEGGAGGSENVTMTYDASTHTAITNPSKTGYTFAGYWTGDNGTGSMVIATDGTLQANVDTYTGDGGIWKKDATCTLYAKWTPNEYAVTLSTTGETGYGSGAPDNQTATYGAAMPTITPPVGAAGYKFQGYFTAANGAGTQYYNADGTSAHEWDIASASTLHAYFQKAEITALEHASSVAKGETTYLVVNPTMNLVPEGYSAICWTLHYAENDNPVSEESWSVDRYTEGGTKQNQVRFTFTNLAVGSYYVKAVLKANASSFDPCSVGTELDTETGNFSVIGSSTVTIKYQYFGTGDVIAASGSVEIPAAGNSDITAPDIIGYSFREWSLGAGVTKNSGSLTDATINISSTYDGVVTAFYNKKQMIYFNNTLEWDTVYVYFYNNGTYWGSTQGSGADVLYFSGAYTGKCGGMTKIPGTSIYYFDLAANSVSTSLTNVVFTEEKQDGYGYFSHNNVIKLSDYSATLSMYVPLTGQTPEKKNKPDNTSNYYWKGYWMNYPDNSGYTLNIYDNTTTGGLRKSIQFPFAADMKMPMAITTDLEGGKTYGFQLYRIDGTTYGNSGTMTNGHSGDEGQGVWEFKSDVANKAGLTTTSAGDYTFTLTYGMDLSSNYNYLIGVRYPESTGDFRVQYKDNENSTWKTSVVIPKLTEADTVSYFVRHSQSPYIRIQKCTATYDAGTTTVTWDDVNEGADILPDTISANGVYNFIFTKAGDNLVLSEVEPYTGNFYIRVDGAGSTNWDSYRAADHIMPFSEYSFDQKTDKYSHYFTKYYKTLKDDGTPDESKNIKFVVANDYSTNISDTVAQDGIADNYVDANGWLSGRNANIRFMYNYKTNVATRRYLDGAQEDDSEFLLLIPSNNTSIYDVAEGGSGKTQVKFSDNGNWIYEASVYVVPGTTYKLKSSFGAGVGTTIVQYLKGAESGVGEYETLIGGSGSRLKIRLLYDFKTNRVIAAYVPSNNDEISGDNAINADIMFMREHQGDVTQITFATNESKISAIQNVYSVLKFNKTTINNLGLSRYERDLFYVSFPYNVPVSDIIGFGEYGKHWIIEYYDGAGRAEKGFWADSKSFWKFVTPAMKNSFTLQAGTGYIVALDLDEMETGDDIWENTDQVELIFPGDISMISDQEVTYTMPQHQCNIGPRFEGGDDRRIKDSHWNVLGVPTYHNTTGTFANHTDEIGDKSQVWSTDGKPNYLYTWNMTDNSLSVTNASSYNYKAMHAYIVQYYGDVTFHTSTNAAPASVAARTYANAPSEVQFRLEIQQNEQTIDQTFITMSDDETVSSQFVFGEDLSKEFNTNRANIYTMVTSMLDGYMTTTETAGNTLPMTNQTTIVPVGVKIAADGEYTFSIPEGTYGVGITLIDNEAGARVNLGLMDYTVTLAAGQIDDRFVLEISPVHQSPTGVELLNGENGENGVRKVLIDNILYIVKDGKVFDAQGKRLQ